MAELILQQEIRLYGACSSLAVEQQPLTVGFQAGDDLFDLIQGNVRCAWNVSGDEFRRSADIDPAQ